MTLNFTEIDSILLSNIFIEVSFNISASAEGSRACSLKPQTLMLIDDWQPFIN
jgi:hypothetical protein